MAECPNTTIVCGKLRWRHVSQAHVGIDAVVFDSTTAPYRWRLFMQETKRVLNRRLNDLPLPDWAAETGSPFIVTGSTYAELVA